MDLVGLQTNANKALDELLKTKGSIDARRWRAVWELGMMLCQNESQYIYIKLSVYVSKEGCYITT